MTAQSAVAVFEAMDQVEEAVRKLHQGHFPIKQVSLVAQHLETGKEVHGLIIAGQVAKSGAGSGAWVGGIFGLLIGEAFLFVPGFGPVVVAGPLAAALLGTVQGAAFGVTGGGLLGALTGWGVSGQRIIKYENYVQGGKYLLVVQGRSAELERAQDILRMSRATELNRHFDGSTVSLLTEPVAAR